MRQVSVRTYSFCKYSKVLLRFFLIFKHCIWFSFRGDICQCKNHWHHEKGQGVFKDFFLKRRCLIQFFDPVYFYYSNSEGSHRSWGKLFVCKSSGFNHLSSMTSFTSPSQTPLSFRNIIVALKNPQNTVASDHSNHYVNFARVVKFSIKTCSATICLGLLFFLPQEFISEAPFLPSWDFTVFLSTASTAHLNGLPSKG